MGVQGLTSYISENSDVYFERFKLKDCILIIDGYGLASQLHNSSTKTNSAFGGDYDKYCNVISNFFEILKKCKITPLVICDGGYEKKKLATVKRRNLCRVYALENVTPSCVNRLCYPLMMRNVFKEKLLELSVTVLQTDFEADNEIAALAKKLDCPVLSNDSDFYIYNVRYIPLTSMLFNYYENNGGDFFIPCQIFSINNMLKTFGNSPKPMLPLLATLLGNDYIKVSNFKRFYSHLKMDKSKKMKTGCKRVKGLINWLKSETFESAMIKILRYSKKNARQSLKRKIYSIINGYTDLNTTLDLYLPENILNKNGSVKICEVIDSFSSLCSLESSEESDNKTAAFGHSNSSNEESESESDATTEDETNCNFDVHPSNLSKPLQDVSIPQWLLNESRIGNMCPSINTLLLLKVFLYCPQVEDYECQWSGSVTLPILQTIIGLLGLPCIDYWYRDKLTYSNSKLLATGSISELIFPQLSDLNLKLLPEKKLILLKALMVESPSILDTIPCDWNLFFIAIVYWIQKTEYPLIKHWHLHALIMTIIVVNVIGGKIGSFWQRKKFLIKYGAKLSFALQNNASKSSVQHNTINTALEMVTWEDCLIAMDSLIPYFHIDKNISRNSKIFSRTTIHIYAQLQSVFELTVTLNSLLLQPFKRCHLGNFYNGTFLYNFTSNFKNRSNILAYVNVLFKKSTSLYDLYIIIYNTLIKLIPTAPQQIIKSKGQKKKKEIRHSTSDSCDESASDMGDFKDENNRFSLLNSCKKNSK